MSEILIVAGLYVFLEAAVAVWAGSRLEEAARHKEDVESERSPEL